MLSLIEYIFIENLWLEVLIVSLFASWGCVRVVRWLLFRGEQ